MTRSATAKAARALLAELADSWNRGNPRSGADCFTSDAIYLEPPSRQRYMGLPNCSASSVVTPPMSRRCR